MKNLVFIAAVLLAILLATVAGYAEPENDNNEEEQPQEAKPDNEEQENDKEEEAKGPGKTPEETVKNFFDAFKKGDVDTIVNCMSENFIEELNAMRAWIPRMPEEQVKKEYGMTPDEIMELSDKEFAKLFFAVSIKEAKESGELEKISMKIVETKIDEDDENLATVKIESKIEDNEGTEATITLKKIDGLWYIETGM